jgi:hypothetical protein
MDTMKRRLRPAAQPCVDAHAIIRPLIAKVPAPGHLDLDHRL